MVQREGTGHRPPVLKFEAKKYAQSPNEVLPRQYFVGCWVAPRGKGKTYGATQLIRSFERNPPRNEDGTVQALRTVIFSPTFDANEVFQSLRSLDEKDVHRAYSTEVLGDLLADIEKEREETETFRREQAVYQKFRRVKRADQLTEEELWILEKNDFEPPQEKPKYPHGCSIFLCIDDMVGSEIFKAGKKNPFVNLLLRNRHHRINILILSQYLRAIPRTIRANISVWSIGQFGSRGFLPDLYEEIASGDMTQEQFEALYDTATGEEHGSLVIDFTKKKTFRYMKNWEEYLKPQ
jgi:hypothetical protein